MKENLEKEILLFKSDMKGLENHYGIKILLAYVRGSHMYGTATHKSDVDITFVYQQPTDEILKGNYREQISIGKNDTVGYEIQRFLQLLSQNNPNILEALDIPEDCLIYMDESIKPILDQKLWLSKLTKNTILGYAQSQIKKATGLNKHMNRQDVAKKDLIDFCYVIHHDQTKSLKTFTTERGIDINKVGLSKAGNGKGMYFMYFDNEGRYNLRGLLKDSDSTQLRLSSIPKELSDSGMFCVVHYNQDSYESWKKEYESYQKWLTERNETRYNTNNEHGKGYDCYLDSETEYLTEKGWMKYDDITNDIKLASIDSNKDLVYLPILDRTKEKYEGDIYFYEDRYTKFSVTPNHNLFVSKFTRNKKTGFKSIYSGDSACWELKPAENVFEKGDYFYLSHLNCSRDERLVSIPDEWFFILGGFTGDGHVIKSDNGNVESISISQNENSRLYNKLCKLDCRKNFSKNTKGGDNYIFTFTNKDLVKWVIENVGYTSKNKELNWKELRHMSDNQFDLFYEGLINSDGTTHKVSGHQTYYSISKKLVDSLQMLLFTRGIYCQIYDYEITGTYPTDTEIYYHLSLPKNSIKRYRALQRKKSPRLNILKVNEYISCFTVSTGILITRNNNKIAIQGNSKNMMHLHRLLEMAAKISIGQGLQVRSEEVEYLREIREGKYDYDELMKKAEVYTEIIKKNFETVDLQDSPDTNMMKELLLKFRKYNG